MCLAIDYKCQNYNIRIWIIYWWAGSLSNRWCPNLHTLRDQKRILTLRPVVGLCYIVLASNWSSWNCPSLSWNTVFPYACTLSMKLQPKFCFLLRYCHCWTRASVRQKLTDIGLSPGPFSYLSLVTSGTRRDMDWLSPVISALWSSWPSPSNPLATSDATTYSVAFLKSLVDL